MIEFSIFSKLYYVGKIFYFVFILHVVMNILNIFILQSDYMHFQPTLSLLQLFLCYVCVCVQLYTYYILYTETEKKLSVFEVTGDIKVPVTQANLKR